jgi:hypothetical protein
VPAQLESLIMKSLEKNRDNRFATAADFANALEAIRATIPPDQKYGLGERMVTLSAAKTLQELPKYSGATGTMGSQQTMQTSAGQQKTQQTAITSSQNEATVLERGVTKSTASNEATVIERMGGTSSGAAATVLEPKIAPPKKNSMALGAIAAAVVIALLIGAYYFLRRPMDSGYIPSTRGPVVDTTATSGTQITTTAAPLGAQGKLQLSASPWGELEKIVNLDNNKSVDLSDEKRSTPTTIDLDPGKYAVTVRGPDSSQTIDVSITAGQRLKKQVTTANVDFDEIEKEVKPQ